MGLSLFHSFDLDVVERHIIADEESRNGHILQTLRLRQGRFFQ